MKFTIANDIHLGSKHATHTWEAFQVLVAASENEGIVLNGDIVDIANCKKSEVEIWRSRANLLRAIAIANCGHYILGNHEINQIKAPNSLVIDNVYFAHGDYFFWSKEKADRYRSKKAGAGFLKRWFTPVYDNLRHFADGGPNEQFFKSMDEVLRVHPNIRAAVFGHRHPKENIIFDYKGVKCCILKRGVQTLDI